MNDEELKEQLEEVVEDAEEVIEQEESAQEVEESENEEKIERPQEMNFKKLRKQLEEAEKERDEAKRVAWEYDNYYKQQQFQPNTKANTPVKDEDDDLSDDELIEVRHLKKLERKIDEKINSYRR